MPKANQEHLLKMRHSCEHVLTLAMQELYGQENIVMAMGPATDDGFYFDFDQPRDFKVSEENFPQIEAKMAEIIKKDLKFEKVEVPSLALRKVFENNPYKLEWLDEIDKQGEKPTVYFMGEEKAINADKQVLLENNGVGEIKSFFDLCKGPHVASTKEIKVFKLLSIAGAYWRGNEKNIMLTRIYGTAFDNQADLKEHLKMLEEAELYNHRRIGKELELFAVIKEIGQGLPVWLPKGYAMRRALEDYMIQLERKFGYEHILTPHINKKELFEISGHLGFYKESMYPPLEFDNETYYLKPMNCPAGMMVYNLKPRSYRDLPLKMGELGTVYRYEKSGELHGLQRVRGFTQNDAHIFCSEEQLEEQFMEVIKMMHIFYKDIGFDDYKYRLSLSDEDSKKYVGKREDWLKAEKTLKQVLDKNKIDYEEVKGEAAFYGPKIDVQAINIYGKEDSISTIQVDFNLPERFNINYIDAEQNFKRPFVIHRALVGSFERFFAFLIEHHKGAFPIWFSPVQVKILTISDKQQVYARQLHAKLLDQNIRVEIDERSERLQAKIRDAQMMKVPVMLIIGDKEVQNNSVNVRLRTSRQISMSTDAFTQALQKMIKARVISLEDFGK